MLPILLTVVLGIVGGLAVGMQGPIATAMSQRIGGLSGILVVHLGGAALAGVLLVARGGEQIGNWRSLSWYMFAAGFFGVVLYLTLYQTLPRLGATTAIVLIIIGQLLMGMLIDHFGWFGVAVRPLDVGRVLAVALLLAGAYLAVR